MLFKHGYVSFVRIIPRDFRPNVFRQDDNDPLLASDRQIGPKALKRTRVDPLERWNGGSARRHFAGFGHCPCFERASGLCRQRPTARYPISQDFD
jgi:hypothetical protein